MEIDQENRSEEHIIHNAIGGILKSDSIYCKKCNSKYGSDLDKAFTEIFAPIIDGLDMNFDRKTGKTSYKGLCAIKREILIKHGLKMAKLYQCLIKMGNIRNGNLRNTRK